MKNKQLILGLASAGAMVALILDGKTALTGAREGVILCLMTVIPSLFPFFLLSGTLTNALMGASPLLLRPFAALLGISRGAEALAVSALLGGYPAGAQAVQEAQRAGYLDKSQAQWLLPVCNQPGPAFLFGMVGLLFPKEWMIWALWAVILLSAGLTGMVLPIPQGSAKVWDSPKPAPLPDTLRGSLRAMGAVCGWVVIFRVVLAFCQRWWLWLLPGEVQVGLTGALELSNGCILLGQVEDLRLRFCLAAGMLSFGGLCVALQTQSVAQGLFRRYLPGKALQGLLAVAISLCVAYGIWWFLAGIFLGFLTLRQKRCRNPRVSGV